HESKNKSLASNEKNANRWFDMTEEEQTRRDTIVSRKQVEKAALTESNMESSGRMIKPRLHDVNISDLVDIEIVFQLQNVNVG
ncbi:16647_t:CDS:1, partial [Racocetra fulgida]